MLRSDFRFPLDRWPQRVAAFLLGESFLGFLAIVAVGLTAFQLLFTVPAHVHAALDGLQWVIIAWFAVEYVVAFTMAPVKRAFVLNPWRILDVVTILIPLAALLPNVSGALLSSPVLRLVRLARLVSLGVRVSGVAVRHRAIAVETKAATGAAEFLRMGPEDGGTPRRTTWDEVLGVVRAGAREWVHVASPSPEQLAELGRAAQLSPGFVENHFLGTSYPHLATEAQWGAVFLWLPEDGGRGHEGTETRRVERYAGLFLFTANTVVSLSRRPTREIERIATGVGLATESGEMKASFGMRILARVVRAVVGRNEEMVGRFEQELRGLEDVPVRESSPAFFERTFRVKKELSAAKADLWRLKGVVADLATGRTLPSGSDGAREIFRSLATAVEYLYETVVDVRDEVLSVLELHLNIVSFDMNRVMRVLAVVSVLGLIPAVIGGLFGMNLIDNPWPFTLPQVAFGVCFGMTLCVYFFFVKGWLR